MQNALTLWDEFDHVLLISYVKECITGMSSIASSRYAEALYEHIHQLADEASHYLFLLRCCAKDFSVVLCRQNGTLVIK